MRKPVILAALTLALATTAAHADDLKIALIYGKTGPLEAYAKQTETGLRMGLEYATKNTMTVDGRKIVLITKDDQGKPDLAKAALAEAYQDDKVDIAIGTTASAPSGTTPPVEIAIASPGASGRSAGRPAAIRSTTGKVPGVSVERSANPSIAELGKRGRSIAANAGSASTRPAASTRATASVSSG